MKKITKLSVVIALFVGSFATYAQEVLVVQPGTGTLNTAVATYKGDRIYQLQAGKFYQLDGILENDGYALQIVGEVPVGGGKPATLQTNNVGGVPFANMINALGDVTLKNVYFVNADFSDVVGFNFMGVNAANVKIVIDHCVLNPVAIANGIVVGAEGVEVMFTNTLAMNFGHQLSPNDGHFFVANAPLKQLNAENNTFVCMGTNMFAGGLADYRHGQIVWNHNTWVMQKSQLDWSVYEERFVFTNNLMYDFNTQPWSQAWQPMPGGDLTAPKPGLIYAGVYPGQEAKPAVPATETTPEIPAVPAIPGESFPLERQQYAQYNNLYRDPGFYALLDELNAIQLADGKAKLTYMPLVWGPEYNASNPDINFRSRETIEFENKVDFPNWKYGNTFDTDPQFEDPRIYAHSKSFVEWTRPASLVHAMGQDPTTVPPTTEWAQWHWYEGQDAAPGNNAVWPVFNAKYTNAEMLTGSIESLPLGDLNWFPAEKAIWEANKPAIDAHIAAGNTGKIAMLATKTFKGLDKFGFNYYPNPAKNELRLSATNEISDVTIYNLLGQEVMSRKVNSTNSSVDISTLSRGTYIFKVVIENTVGTYKIVKQ